MRAIAFVLAVLACEGYARRMQTKSDKIVRDWESENIARHRAGEMNDAELGLANLKMAMHDPSLLQDVAEGLRHPEGRAELIKMMADPNFQAQAKRIAEQLKMSGIPADFLKLEYYAALSPGGIVAPTSQMPERQVDVRMETLNDLIELGGLWNTSESVAAEPGFDRVRSFKEKDEEKLAREARKKKFAGERIGEAKNPGPNYWRRPCWWGADCQWHKEGRCQFWHGETLGNSDEPVGKTAERKEHAQEQEEKEEPPWWAKQLILDNARLSWQVAELSEDNALLRQKVEDLTEVVKSIWETGDSGKTEEGVGNAAQSSMERHALDAEDASGKTEEGAGNTAQTVRDEQSDTVGNAAQSSKERHALDAEDASGKTEEGAGRAKR